MKLYVWASRSHADMDRWYDNSETTKRDAERERRWQITRGCPCGPIVCVTLVVPPKPRKKRA